MPHGWRTRLHHLTRNRRFLIKTSLGIVLGGFVTACLIAWLGAEERRGFFSVHVDVIEQRIREGYHRLLHDSERKPRELSRWLQRVISQREHLCDVTESEMPTAESFLADGKIAVYQLRSVIEKHATEGAERQMFSDFALAAVDREDERAQAAAMRVKNLADIRPARFFANELIAFLHTQRGEKAAALDALVIEGAFEDAALAREKALRLALEKKDEVLLRDLMARPQWRDAAPPLVLHRIGALTGDLWLQWGSLLNHQLMNARIGMLLIALLAGAIWFIIFTQRSHEESWRWARPFLPLIAGVFSVWPTLAILIYQEDRLGMSSDAPFPYDLWYWIGGVGLREELCKLALFSLFLPWLLWRRHSGLALLTGAFVGLGFALEENVSNYYGDGGAVVWTRLLTANFFHAALSGIAGLALYELLRSRFAQAERFLFAFIGVVVVHGVYDYVLSPSFMFDGGSLRFLYIVILALVANHFFDLLAQHTKENPGIIGPAAVFLIGSALLIAVLFISAALAGLGMDGIATVGQECAAIAPVMWVYWRKFPLTR
jgi:RsiW-degrading membrane proteinase PrsW (M82 family)